ncbi:MAG: MraY family glycosyltransferase [Chitinophagaceae bacterium]
MDQILLGSAIAFLITFLAIPIIIHVAHARKLFDLPDDRKIHIIPVPALGGVGIFAGFMIASLFIISFYSQPDFQYFYASMLVIFFLGLKDDLLVLSPSKKFMGQVIASFLIVYKGELIINNMHGFLGLNEIPQLFSYAVTYLTIIVITNSFNLIDGVDGLAGSLGILTTFLLGTYFYFNGDLAYSVMAFCMSGSLLAFLIFNHSPARIFMGDTGSLLVGLVNSILVIHFINTAGSPNSVIPISASPAMGIAILMIPLYDTLRVFTLRIINRKSPFTPDTNHLHHLMLEKGMSHLSITYTMVGVNVFIIATAYFLRELNTNWVVLSLLTVGICSSTFLHWSARGKAIQLPSNGVIKMREYSTTEQPQHEEREKVSSVL